MGCMKFRQGRTINVGIPLNHSKPMISFTPRREAVDESRVGWLMATVHAITKPFVRMVQNYRGRGNR